MSAAAGPTMVDRACPVCGSNEQRLFAEQNVDFEKLDAFAFASRKLPEYMHWRLVECSQCELLYASPVPAKDFLHANYRAAAFDSGPEAVLASETYARELRRFVGRLPDRNGAVDIGTGEGAFLKRLLELGFNNVVGFEPSIAPIEQASAGIRPLIQHGLFDATELPKNAYSLVSCFQTIEHVAEPGRLAEDALRLLKSGGAFMIVCHNRKALSAKLLGRRSPIFDVEHLQLFSPKSIRRLLEANGYTNVTVRRLVNAYPLNYWLRLFPLPRSLKRGAQRATTAIRTDKLLVPLPAGNLVAYGFKL